MVRLAALLFVLFSITVISCKKEDTDANPLAGNLRGTYTGTGDNGTLNLTIGSDRKVTGTVTSAVANQAFAVNGALDIYGTVTFSIGTTSPTVSFTGNFTTSNDVSGSWTNSSRTPATTGTWTATRQ